MPIDASSERADPRATNQPPAAAAPRRASRRALVIGTIAFSCILAIVLLVVAEIVLRLMRASPPPGSLVIDERLGWDRRPSWEKPIPASVSPPAGAAPLRVLFMGDSFTHNTAWSRLTIEALNARGISAMGWEAGVSGYGQVQEAMKLESIIPELTPDVVVILFYAWNDPRDNFPAPGIVYNPNMLERPYLEPDGTSTPLDTTGMRVRSLELVRLAENWWFARHLKASRRAMREKGADGPAAANERVLTSFSDPLTWMPFYQPSAQESPYVRGAWDATRRALARAQAACAQSGAALVVVGIDAPFTIDRDVFDAHVATEPKYRADDFDVDLPLRRFADVVRALGLEPVLPAAALKAHAKDLGQKIYDNSDLSAHLKSDDGEGAKDAAGAPKPAPQRVLAREVAEAIARALEARGTSKEP